MENFTHPEVPTNYNPEQSKDGDIYEKVEKAHRISEADREKLGESLRISEVVAILQSLLQDQSIDGKLKLNDFLEEVQDEQKVFRYEKKYENANTLENIEGILRDAVNEKYLNPGMTIDQVLDAFSLRWRELQDELDKKGLKF